MPWWGWLITGFGTAFLLCFIAVIIFTIVFGFKIWRDS